MPDDQPVAANGLLDRRLFLQGGAGTALALSGISSSAADGEELRVEPWMKLPGSPFVGYGQPSRFEDKVVRVAANPPNAPGTGAARTPLHRLNGTITPNGLHFERSHSGIPDIDPDAHRFLIHGLIKRPLVFTLETLSRYPVESRIAFIECGGNGNQLYQKDAAPLNVQALQGADAAGMSRSVPLAKAMDDALIALYQNGERIRPSNGYPMRLLLPGYEGNMQVKWLRRIKVTEGPTMTKDETSKYTMLLLDGKSLQFVFPIEAKSVITQPSPGLVMNGPGLYEISGIAWSGYGKITKVEVSADGGKTWAPAALQQPVLSMALTRFRVPWQWSGGPAILQSRATDGSGYVQPTRAELIARRGAKAFYHFNGVTSWGVTEIGEVKHVYA